MPTSEIDRIIDPLTDRFAADDLRRIAPWVAEKVASVGIDAVGDAIARRGGNPAQPQPMSAWVAALADCGGPLWEELDVA